jgi:adenosylhomocysteine nucleosidase
MIGIIGAMNEEIIELKSLMKDIEEVKLASFTYFKGILEEKEIVLVESGIGKVNSSVCTTLLIEKFGVEKVVFTGVAGGIGERINVGDIVISTDLVQHDFDVTAFGHSHGVIPRMEESFFIADEDLRKLAVKSALKVFSEDKVREGRIVSGDQFISGIDKIDWLSKTFNGEACEMEGASVAHVCHLFKVPFVVIRAISDKANSEAHVDFNEFVNLAAKNSKEIVVSMLREL